jgi:hypothetical protein
MRNLSRDSDQGRRMKLSQSSDPLSVPSKINKTHTITFRNIIFTKIKISMGMVVMQNHCAKKFYKCLQYVIRPHHYQLSFADFLLGLQ